MNTYLLGFVIIITLILTSLLAHKQGSTKKDLLSMMKTGTKKAMMLVQVFFLISILTAAWMASGTIPYLIKLGIDLISPNLFIVSAFLLCTAMSFVTGSSFGTTNTFGVVLIVIARASGVDLWLTAGAILSGVYVGDRCSPMSSALLLLSAVSETEHYGNVKMACKTSVLPVAATTVVFGIFSLFNPMQQVSSSVTEGIAATFQLGFAVLIPMLVLFCFCLLKINVKAAIGMGAFTGIIIALLVQNCGFSELLGYLVLGFQLPEENPVADLVHGGGMISMASVIFVVFFACLLAEVIDSSGLLKKIPFLYQKSAVRSHPQETPEPASPPASQSGRILSGRLFLFIHTTLVGLVMCMVGCNQVMPIIITTAVEKENYAHLTPDDLVRDVSKTAMLLPLVVPWNIAVLTPVTMLGLSGIGYMPYLFFLYFMLAGAVIQYGTFSKYKK